MAWRPRKRGQDGQRGFTLVELLVVVVILGILAAVVLFAFRGDKGRQVAEDIDARTLRTAQEVRCAQKGSYAEMSVLVEEGYLTEPSEYNDVEVSPGGGRCGTYTIIPKTPLIPPLCSEFDPTGGSTTVPTVPSGGLALGDRRLRFEANAGQFDAPVRFVSRSPHYTLFLTPDEMVMSVRRTQDDGADVVRMGLVGAKADPEVVGVSRARSSSNYLAGNDSARWLTDVAHYDRVAYRSVYPGIDLVWHGDGGALEYDFVVAPGADPSVIGQSFTGVEHLRIDDEGALLLDTGGREIVHGRPFVYQDVGGERRRVPGSYVLEDDRVRFDLGEYDLSRPLVIDPKVMLAYSTYMQSPVGSDETANAVATDVAGNTYLTGWTQSRVFPTQNAYQAVPSLVGDTFIFVAKFDPKGQLLYSTYLSGTTANDPDAGHNTGYAIAAGPSGDAFVTGFTSSVDYPVVPAGATYGSPRAGAFLTQLSPAGNQVLYSARLGGGGTRGTGVAVRGMAVHVAGFTEGPDFYPANRSSSEPDGFVAKFQLNTAGAPVYSILLGGTADDKAHGVAVDPAGNAYVTGRTASGDFSSGPTSGALQGTSDSFVAKVASDGTRVWARYIGGSGDEGPDNFGFIDPVRRQAGGIVLDGSGNVHVTGTTNSLSFETAPTSRRGATDAFLATFNADGGIVRSALIGGDGDEDGSSVAVDGAGNVYVAGRTTSTNLVPASQAIEVPQDRSGGDVDGFVVKLDSAGAVAWATYLGGSGRDRIHGIASDPLGNVALAGDTLSSNFPTKNAFQATRSRGTTAGFAARMVFCMETP